MAAFIVGDFTEYRLRSSDSTFETTLWASVSSASSSSRSDSASDFLASPKTLQQKLPLRRTVVGYFQKSSGEVVSTCRPTFTSRLVAKSCEQVFPLRCRLVRRISRFRKLPLRRTVVGYFQKSSGEVVSTCRPTFTSRLVACEQVFPLCRLVRRTPGFAPRYVLNRVRR